VGIKGFVFHWLRADRGQSMVELALILPVMVFALVGGADMARAYAVQVAVQNGARAGAESYAIDSTPTPLEAQNAAVAEMNRTPSIDAHTSDVVVTEANADGTTPYVSHPPSQALPCYVTITVTYTFHTITAWPIVPNSANFNRSTVFQVFY